MPNPFIPNAPSRGLKPALGAQINWGHPINNGLTGCFALNEGGGTRLQNLVTGEVFLTALTSNTMWTPGRDGWALACNGSTNFATLGRPAGMDFTTGDVTMECWYRQDTSVSTAGIWGYYDTAGSLHCFRLWFNTGKLAVTLGNGTTSALVTDSATTVDGKWHQAVAVRTGGKIYLYRDGAVIGNATEALGNIAAASMGWYAGKNAVTGGGTLNGAIGGAPRSWNRGLTANDVLKLYENTYISFIQSRPRRVMTAPSSAIIWPYLSDYSLSGGIEL